MQRTLDSNFSITLAQYIRRRNGVSPGASRSMRNMLYRSFGAKNFSTFWIYWNPIFGYYLGKFIFKPLKKYFPYSLAVISTFIFCGILHDLVTTVIRGRLSLFFSQWFLLMGVCVITSNILKYDFSRFLWITRALINLFIVTTCFLMTLLING